MGKIKHVQYVYFFHLADCHVQTLLAVKNGTSVPLGKILNANNSLNFY